MRTTNPWRWTEMVRSVWIGIVVLVGLPVLVPSCGQTLGATHDDMEVDITEVGASTVDRFRACFRETLDVEPLLDEFFAPGTARREAEVGSLADAMDDLGVSERVLGELDDRELRRAYVAVLNVAYLGRLYALAHQDLESGSDSSAMPPSIRRRFVSSGTLRSRLDEDGDVGGATVSRIETRGALLELVRQLEDVGAAYRGVVSHATFDTAADRESAAALAGGRDGARVVTSDADTGYVRFGVAAGEPVVEVVRDGMLWYDVALVDGRMWIVAVAIGSD